MAEKVKRKKVAVIGSGISGLSAAWFLSQEHQVTLFEKNSKLGGHTNTLTLGIEGKEQPVDTGFIVFNQPNYPYLTEFLNFLKVKTQATEMSFSVSSNSGEFEYSGNNLNTLFAQRKNLLSLAHWKMLKEILRFNRQAKSDLSKATTLSSSSCISLEDYLVQHRFTGRMRDYYLLPMAAAIWSCPVETMLQFPAISFLRFFENHGLLNVDDRPQWESVYGGSEKYIQALTDLNAFGVSLGNPVTQVSKHKDVVQIFLQNGAKECFDEVVFASHADETYDLLDEQLKPDFSLLQSFKYQKNTAYLHSDVNFMPKRKLAWAAWNYLHTNHHQIQNSHPKVAVTYWMNLLQKLPVTTPLLVSLNPINPPDPSLTYKEIIYSHPVFDKSAVEAQANLHSLQGKNNLWFCGSYFGYGFHEDGLASSVNLANLWGIKLPWDKTRGELDEK